MPATCSRKWSLMTVRFIRKNTQRNSSWPGDAALHTKAEYICADLSIDPSLFPCSRTADHTFPGTATSKLRFSLSGADTRYGKADSKAQSIFLASPCSGYIWGYFFNFKTYPIDNGMLTDRYESPILLKLLISLDLFGVNEGHGTKFLRTILISVEFLCFSQ